MRKIENVRVVNIFVNGKKLKNKEWEFKDDMVFIIDTVKMKKKNNKIVIHHLVDAYNT